MVTMVGDDAFGQEARANFSACGVNVDLVMTSEQGRATGVAPIFVDKKGEFLLLLVYVC